MASYGESILKILIYHLIPIEIDGEKIEILERKRPPFLKGLELDFWIPRLHTAFEFQGEQHYTIDGKFIKSYAGLRKRIFYDKTKREICEKMGINLITIGAMYLHPKNFRSYLTSYCDRNVVPLLKELVRVKFYKQNEYKKIRYLNKRVLKYLKLLGKRSLTNYSNRKPEMLIKIQENELKFKQY